MKEILNILKEYKACSSRVACLLHKRNVENMKYNYFCDYIGFNIPNRFVLGYGMDYNELFRDLRHICVISEFAKKQYRE